ncbi:uncharacterized protein N7503_006359 [Penicillium pulvis]|uniref:uncharacterized protein n=1 Tax=Penicillium pulvis TaxID=1562058 RepID=UPI0025489E8D|nr:uncharacterized protein N7503_006359 [Penicillium pulvis]KAJ5798854.1 hypothetical protein N7503_006359 [Penicillium pulvis]
MTEAIRTGKGLRREREARGWFCSFADSDTMLIRHTLYNDFNILRFICLCIVDLSLPTCDAVCPDHPVGKSVPRTWGLKTLTKKRLVYAIQGSKLGHCALKDTQATRKLEFCSSRAQKKVQHGDQTSGAEGVAPGRKAR